MQSGTTSVKILVEGFSNQVHLQSRFSLDSCRLEDGVLLLSMHSDDRPFLSSWNLTLESPVHQVASALFESTIDPGWLCHCYSTDFWSYWSTVVNSDHALFCTKLFMCFDGRWKRTMKRGLDCDKWLGREGRCCLPVDYHAWLVTLGLRIMVPGFYLRCVS